MPQLTLSLLGPMQIQLDGRPPGLHLWTKTQALLAYVAVENGVAHRRDVLAGLLWPEQPEDAARASLRQALRQMRQGLAGEMVSCLCIGAQTVSLMLDGTCRLDVAEFTALLRACDAHSHNARAACPECAERLERAASLYRGDLLAGFFVKDSVAFEEWVLIRREHFRRQVSSALHDLAEYLGLQGAYDRMEQNARRQLELDAFQESAHRQVMRALASRGERAAALRQYDELRDLLMHELGAQPADATSALARQIRTGALPAAHPPNQPAVPASPARASSAGAVAPQRTTRSVFVARERELDRLHGLYANALAGRGQVVFVTGEAGQGKTLLLAEFAGQLTVAAPEAVVAAGNGNAHSGVGDPYLLFREVLALLTGDVGSRWAGAELNPEQARRLWDLVPIALSALVELGPDLIGTFTPAVPLLQRAMRYAGSEWTRVGWLASLQKLIERKSAAAMPAPLQTNLFDQYVQVLRAIAQQKPLLLVLDDLQWADPGSIGLLFHLGRHLEGSRILLAGAFRPAEVAAGLTMEAGAAPLTRPRGRRHDLQGEPAGARRHPLEAVVNEFRRRWGEIELALDRTEDRGFTDALLDSEPNRLGSAFRDTLFRQTQSHPLFTVELLRGMQENGGLMRDGEGYWIEGPVLDWDRLPARVEGVIAERIGRLPRRLRDFLAAASVEGEVFTAEVAAQARGISEREALDWLSGELDAQHHLVRAQGIRRAGARRASLYRFRHSLFQKYLYQSLNAVERARLHEAAGSALEGLYGEASDEDAVQLAWHFREAGIVDKAVTYLALAGERAVRLSANQEAIAHYRQALELLRALPDSREHVRRELKLLVGLAVPLLAGRGYGDAEVGEVYAAAHKLCQQVGETPELFPVLLLLGAFYVNRGDLATGRAILTRVLTIAEEAGDSTLAILGHWGLGWYQFWAGEFSAARDHLEQVVAFYDPERDHALAYLYGEDPGVTAHAVLAPVLWALGFPRQALDKGRAALALARELDDAHSFALAHGFIGLRDGFARDYSALRALSEECVAVCARHGFPYWLATGMFCLGWSLAGQGEVEAGISTIRRGIAAYEETGARLGTTHHYVVLAQALAMTGDVEQGLCLLVEALRYARDTGERCCEAELHRLMGDLVLQRAASCREAVWSEAERHYLQGIDIARRQHALSWELRATLSLCRLWQAEGRAADARRALADVYGRFKEGFESPDLREAVRILRELDGRARAVGSL